MIVSKEITFLYLFPGKKRRQKVYLHYIGANKVLVSKSKDEEFLFGVSYFELPSDVLEIINQNQSLW